MSGPNLVLVVLDTARADRYGHYGYKRPTTPTLDRLADGALVLDQMITQGPWTLPSHATLFTGLYPSEHRAQWRTGLRLDPSSVPITLAEWFSQHGYATASASENGLITSETGLSRGFNKSLSRLEVEGGKPRRLARQAAKALGIGGSGGKVITRLATSLVADLPEPFFLFANYLECHWSYAGYRSLEKKFLRRPMPFWKSVKVRATEGRAYGPWEGVARADVAELERLSDCYDGCVATADRHVEDLLGALRAAGKLANTVFVVTSDHGEHLGEHGLADHHASLSDTLVRVPFLLWTQDRRTPVGRRDELFEFTDVFAALTDVCGLPLPDNLQDRTAHNFAQPGSGRQYAFAEWRRWSDQELRRLRGRNPSYDFDDAAGDLRAVRTRTHKFVDDETHGEYLFDLAADPAEDVNIAEQEPNGAAAMRALLARHTDAYGGAGAPGVEESYRHEEMAEIEKRLEDLGYI